MEALPLSPAALTSSRLDLRRIMHADLDHLAQLYAVPSVTRYLAGARPSLRWTCEQLAGVEEHWDRFGFGQSAVIERATGDFVGRVGLRVREPGDDIELVYVIAKDRQRCGYATEASRAWVAWAREHGLADRLVVVVDPRDQAALRVARTVGFRPDAEHSRLWAGDRRVHRLTLVCGGELLVAVPRPVARDQRSL